MSNMILNKKHMQFLSKGLFVSSGDCSIHQFHGGHVANVPQLQGELVHVYEVDSVL